MGRLQSFPAFVLMCTSFAFTWDHGTSQPTSVTPYPMYFQPFEADAIFSMLKTWNDSGTNTTELWPNWDSLNRSQPESQPCGNISILWFFCFSNLVHIENLTGNEFTLVRMFLVGPDANYSQAAVELVGVLPEVITNLTYLQSLVITGHRRLSGSLPTCMFSNQLPYLKLVYLRNCNFSGNITVHANYDSQIETLDLSSNILSGSPPFCSNDIMNQPRFDSLIDLNLSNNQFSGAFCSDITESIQTIDIRNNGFTDIIFPFGSIVYPLKTLYAQHNHLQRFRSQLLQLPELQEIYLDFNNISGVLILPNFSSTNSSLKLLSLLNNNITNLQPSTEMYSLFSESSLRTSQLLFLGGNPVCKDSRKSKLLQMVCRFNRSSPIEDLYHQASKTPIIISACISAIVLIALIITLFVIKTLLKEIKVMRKLQNELKKKDVKPNLYSYNELKVATQDFHFNNEIGRGGFGIVYKGILIDGSKVAVKRLLKAKHVKQDIQDFLNEIILISNIKHRNLVQLKGCCIKGDQRILVYELVDNDNLADTLWGNSSEAHLDWATRFNIILGIARGLAYLHEEVEPSIVHRDIKGPNILLDKDLNPKIADFGLALFFPSLDDGETHISVSKVAGTMGYLSPEYAIYGQVSTKLDVFSFGVLILEIVSGRKNINYRLPSSKQCLIQWPRVYI